MYSKFLKYFEIIKFNNLYELSMIKHKYIDLEYLIISNVS